MIKDNIILTGLRGSGKTTYGQKLALEKNLPFIDLDHLVEQTENKTITQIVESNGWDYFRELEHRTLKQLKPTKKSIIALGGGTIIEEKNQPIIKELGEVIYLHITPEEAYQRIKNSNTRPPLSPKSLLQELQESYLHRDPIYRKLAKTIKHS